MTVRESDDFDKTFWRVTNLNITKLNVINLNMTILNAYKENCVCKQIPELNNEQKSYGRIN